MWFVFCFFYQFVTSEMYLVFKYIMNILICLNCYENKNKKTSQSTEYFQSFGQFLSSTKTLIKFSFPYILIKLILWFLSFTVNRKSKEKTRKVRECSLKLKNTKLYYKLHNYSSLFHMFFWFQLHPLACVILY